MECVSRGSHAKFFADYGLTVGQKRDGISATPSDYSGWLVRCAGSSK